MIYTLARTRQGHEFAAAEAITALGALATAPRKVHITPPKDGKPERPEYAPILPRLLFIASTEAQWYAMTKRRMIHNGKLLPPLFREFIIPPYAWHQFQDFAARAEQECEYRRGLHEQGRKVRNYRPGEMLRIIGGDMLDGQLGEFIKLEHGRVVVQTKLILMGKAVVARIDPSNVTGMAAE
jgi:hypothetical protein